MMKSHNALQNISQWPVWPMIFIFAAFLDRSVYVVIAWLMQDTLWGKNVQLPRFASEEMSQWP